MGPQNLRRNTKPELNEAYCAGIIFFTMILHLLFLLFKPHILFFYRYWLLFSALYLCYYFIYDFFLIGLRSMGLRNLRRNTKLELNEDHAGKLLFLYDMTLIIIILLSYYYYSISLSLLVFLIYYFLS